MLSNVIFRLLSCTYLYKIGILMCFWRLEPNDLLRDAARIGRSAISISSNQQYYGEDG